MTHYIPAFTHRDRWNQQQAVCGEYVDANAHANQPTCPACHTWVLQDAAEYAEILRGLSDDVEPRRI